MGVPIIITIILLKRFGKDKNNEDYLLDKIRELERRIDELEREINDLYEFSE